MSHSYGHFRNTDLEFSTHYKLDQLNQTSQLNNVKENMNINNEDTPVFYLNLSPGEISQSLMSYFPEGLPVLILNESPCEYRRRDGSKFWILDSEHMSKTQITMLTHIYKTFSTQIFPVRYVLPNNTQYGRNIIEETEELPFILHGTDFAVNVKIVDQSEDWLLQGKTEPEQITSTSTKKTTTPRRNTTRKNVTNKLELPNM